MNQLSHAEAHILDRIMYLLEEASVARLTQTDESFATYIADLYATINAKSLTLRDTTA